MKTINRKEQIMRDDHDFRNEDAFIDATAERLEEIAESMRDDYRFDPIEHGQPEYDEVEAAIEYGDDCEPDYSIEGDDYDDPMDGDWDSGMASAGWGTDEDYGYYGSDEYDYYGDGGDEW